MHNFVSLCQEGLKNFFQGMTHPVSSSSLCFVSSCFLVDWFLCLNLLIQHLLPKQEFLLFHFDPNSYGLSLMKPLSISCLLCQSRHHRHESHYLIREEEGLKIPVWGRQVSYHRACPTEYILSPDIEHEQ